MPNFLGWLLSKGQRQVRPQLVKSSANFRPL